MSSTYASADIIGRLAREWEIRHTKNGKKLATNALAVNHKKDDGGHFIDIVVWEKAADLVTQYTQKGDPLFVVGRIVQEKWEKDGHPHSKLVVHVNEFKFLGGGKREGQQQGRTNSHSEIDDNDIPW